MSKIYSISLEDLYARHSALAKNEIVLDVRTTDEFNSGHVPGSTNISHDVLETKLDSLHGVEKINIYCRAGARAQFAAEILKKAGIAEIAVVTSGGMPDWAMCGYPVEK